MISSVHPNQFLNSLDVRLFLLTAFRFETSALTISEKRLKINSISMGVVLVIMRILCILFESLLLCHSQSTSPCRNKDMEISCESAV